MKNSFKILGAFAFLFALSISFYAFKADTKQTVRTEQWYQYDGSGDRTLPENYTFFGSSAPGCTGTEEICAVRAMDNGNQQPEITEDLKDEINAAISSDTPTVNVSLLD